MSGKKSMSRGARQALVEGLIMAVLAVLGWFYAIPKLGLFGVPVDGGRRCDRPDRSLPGPDEEPEDRQTAGGGPPGGRPGETGGAV